LDEEITSTSAPISAHPAAAAAPAASHANPYQQQTAAHAPAQANPYQPAAQQHHHTPQLPTGALPLANRSSIGPVGGMAPSGSNSNLAARPKSVFLPPNKSLQRVMNVDRMDKRRSIYVVQNYAAQLSPADAFSIQFYLPDQQTLELKVRGSDPIKHVKESLGQQAREKLNIDMGPMDKYLLKVPGASFLNDESAAIKSLPYVVNCIKRNSYPQFILLEKVSPFTKKVRNKHGTLKILYWPQLFVMCGDR